MSDEKQYEIVYFKPSGKYYTSEKVTWPKDAPDHSGWNPLSTFHRIGEMYAVCMNAPHGFPQFSPPKTVYDLQQTIYELNCRVVELKREFDEEQKAKRHFADWLVNVVTLGRSLAWGSQPGFQSKTQGEADAWAKFYEMLHAAPVDQDEAKVALASSDVIRLQEQLAMAKREINSLGEVLEDIRVALGQNDTHYLVMADDVKALVHAVSQCEGGDGKCPAQTVLALLQQDPGCGGSKEASTDIGCAGTPGAASWGRCEKSKDHPPPCTHDPAPRVAPGEKLKLQDPRFGTPEHMQARWKNSGLRGPFFIQSSNHGPCVIRECNGQKVVTECQTREIASAIVDALDAYDGGKKP